MRRSNSKLHGFSLVETLVVLTITSILTVMTISSIQVLRSTSLSASGNQITDVFAMARQNSVSKNAYTAVVIKSSGTGAYSAYCLVELTRGDDGNFGSWTAVTPWHTLGQGVLFDNSQSFMATPTLPKAWPASFPYTGGTSIDLNSTAKWQCYQPDGTLVGDQSTALRLRLLSATTGTATPTNFYDLVFVGNTGVTKIERP